MTTDETLTAILGDLRAIRERLGIGVSPIQQSNMRTVRFGTGPAESEKISGAFETAIEVCGSQAELARRIGKKQAHVWNWLNRHNAKVPAEACALIESATGGQVTRQDLRPDVFGKAIT